MYIITGATGQTGSAVANTLLKQGLPVRVIVRSEEKGKPWKQKGAEIAVAELNDAEALSKAFAGGKVLYLMNPPNYRSEDMFAETEKNIAAVQAALKISPIEKLVILSSAGAFHSEGVGNIRSLYLIEQAFKDAEIPITFVRPPNFMENWNASIEQAANEGILASFFAPLDAKFPHVSAEEVGKIAAEAMLENTSGITYKELGGIAYSPNDVADAFSKVIGKPVTAVEIPEVEWHDIFRSFCSEKNAEANVEMFRWFRSDPPIFTCDDPVKTTTTIDDYAQRMLGKK